MRPGCASLIGARSADFIMARGHHHCTFRGRIHDRTRPCCRSSNFPFAHQRPSTQDAEAMAALTRLRLCRISCSNETWGVGPGSTHRKWALQNGGVVILAGRAAVLDVLSGHRPDFSVLGLYSTEGGHGTDISTTIKAGIVTVLPGRPVLQAG